MNAEEKDKEEKQSLDFIDELDVIDDPSGELIVNARYGEYRVIYHGITIKALKEAVLSAKEPISELVGKIRELARGRKAGVASLISSAGFINTVVDLLSDVITATPDVLLGVVSKSIEVEFDGEDPYPTIAKWLDSLSGSSVSVLFAKIWRITDIDLLKKVFIGLADGIGQLIDQFLPPVSKNDEEKEESEEKPTPPKE